MAARGMSTLQTWQVTVKVHATIAYKIDAKADGRKTNMKHEA
jgi:hypothetical protein